MALQFLSLPTGETCDAETGICAVPPTDAARVSAAAFNPAVSSAADLNRAESSAESGEPQSPPVIESASSPA